jgi:type IV secretion system protein TrbL
VSTRGPRRPSTRKPSQRRSAELGGTGVIDQFLNVFTQYIDSGFGLLQGEVKWLAGVLIAIDLVLAALFWAWAPDENVIARLVKKTLFIGVFAYIINNWTTLSRIVFESFAGLGLKASGTGLSLADFLRPGRIAQTGIDAGKPILDSISGLMGFVSFFENFIQIAVLLFAWVLVVLAFFVMAIQLFVSLIEFKLTTICGFVLIPFGLFNKTAFAAERVLGNVMSSGIKVLVLAVIVGIGSTLFSQFTAGFSGTPTIEDALGLVLAALSLLGLAIFGPGIANGIISGGPQLGAGAAVGTGLAAGGVMAAGAGLAAGGVGLAGSAAGAAAGAARGGASIAGAATTAYRTASAGQTGMSGVASGLGGVARAGASSVGQAMSSPLRRAAASMGESYRSGAHSAFRATGGTIGGQGAGGAAPTAESAGASGGEPGWARAMRRRQSVHQGVTTAAHVVQSGDRGGSGSSIEVGES